jgi:hypothetical protein
VTVDWPAAAGFMSTTTASAPATDTTIDASSAAMTIRRRLLVLDRISFLRP